MAAIRTMMDSMDDLSPDKLISGSDFNDRDVVFMDEVERSIEKAKLLN